MQVYGLICHKLFSVARVSREEKSKKEKETPEAPVSANKTIVASATLSGQRTRRQSQGSARHGTPSAATPAPRERWSQRREKKLRMEEAK